MIIKAEDDISSKRKETFEQWGERIKKLAPNLDYTNDDGSYNYKGAYEAGLEPVEVDNNGVKEYHLPSRNPITGEILKSRNHPTFNEAIREEIKLGYIPYEKDGKIYTVSKDSEEYKTLYNSGKLMYYDENTDVYKSPTLEELNINDKATGRGKYLLEYENDNPYKPYIETNEYLIKYKPHRVAAIERLNRKEWERKRDNYADVMIEAERRINELWDYEKRKKEGKLTILERKVEGVETTPKQDEMDIVRQAQMQLAWKNKPLEDKIMIIGSEAAIALLPEIAIDKYAHILKNNKQISSSVSKVSAIKLTNKTLDFIQNINKLDEATNKNNLNLNLLKNDVSSEIKNNEQ